MVDPDLMLKNAAELQKLQLELTPILKRVRSKLRNVTLTTSKKQETVENGQQEDGIGSSFFSLQWTSYEVSENQVSLFSELLKLYQFVRDHLDLFAVTIAAVAEVSEPKETTGLGFTFILVTTLFNGVILALVLKWLARAVLVEPVHLAPADPLGSLFIDVRQTNQETLAAENGMQKFHFYWNTNSDRIFD
jgi:hypothetical protein